MASIGKKLGELNNLMQQIQPQTVIWREQKPDWNLALKKKKVIKVRVLITQCKTYF